MFERSKSTQADALRRASQALPGGTVSSFRLPPEVAIVVSRGQGSHLWDLDGREYVDYVLGSGPLILGHAHPAVVQAVGEQITLGSHYYTLSEPAIRLAEEIIQAVPCAEKVRFAGTGSEATFMALRLARAYTGRNKIMKFEGAYNGNHDYSMMSVSPTSPRAFPTPTPDTAGIPESLLGDVLVAPFNDTETALAIMERNARDLAAVILEPVQRIIAPKPGFLQALRTATRDLGIVLIFDEVVTGFRLAYGGAQEYYGVVPDLAAYGKIIGGGYPLAAVAGKAELMELCDSSRSGSPEYVYLSGTLNGNPVGAAAGLATLAELRKPGRYERLHEAGERMRKRLATVFAERGIRAQAVGVGPLFRLVFTDRPIESYRDLLASDRQRATKVGVELLKRGFFVNPGDKVYISLAHSDDDLDSYVAAVAAILDEA